MLDEKELSATLQETRDPNLVRIAQLPPGDMLSALLQEAVKLESQG
jgi:hypothetical protein